MTEPNLRPIDLIAKVAGISLRRTFYVLCGIRDNDVHAQRQYGKRTQESVMYAYKLVSVFMDDPLDLMDILPRDDIAVPTTDQVVACSAAYRTMIDQQLV
jgi:hypothetical protein